MDIVKITERLMKMDDEVWERHANPFSVWSRFTVLPLFALAVWSRVWIGWGCLIPVLLVALWTWINPRLFAKPVNTDNWASKGVRGERYFLKRKAVPIPHHHLLATRILGPLSGFAALVFLWGLWALNLWATLTGLILTMVFKAWFVDRMVWLTEDMER